ncbi:amino-acid N-acetyltransferase [Candidatus Parabeggiatoa sp. HSG14]|uniref:amino-acid N-acetyltransferase n=1 Tax=Candidatus Parabeggiatoa sp. HSG14 TaxID=3055593 RepID=UPI0025A77899|nr:amino-acid N-acetyltransferase [Thiotrichales bacterium HSG14]
MFSNDTHQFVDWFRNASPYIHAHRGRTFVICFGGEAVQSPHFSYLIQDIALLNSLGIRLVLVYGIRPQIEQYLQTYGQKSCYANGIRVTDEIALKCVKAACGEVRTEIESLLSMGLCNSPTDDVRIRTASGNFVTARPLGVRDGVDYCYTGEVRRIDVTAITRQLDEGCIVLISPIGYSPTGETFNLLAEDIATKIAIALQAAKWICLTENGRILDNEGQLVRQLTVFEAQRYLAQQNFEAKKQLNNAVKACQNGVQRVHLISRKIEGSLLLELFSRDGIGTLISTDPYEHIRKATIEDVGGVIELIEPLEEAGILMRRSREKLEMEINHFTVQERDGMIIACAALYPFTEENMAELACLAVHNNYLGKHRGDALLTFLEREARKKGIAFLFVLTTQTAHWFQERGFITACLDSLPMSKRTLYNYQRNSKVFIKQL